MTTEIPTPATAGAVSSRFDAASREAVDICRELIRFDTQNWGNGKANPERPAAEYIAGLFAEVGLESVIHEAAPGRASLVARIPGTDPSAGALVVHGHTDVVPADASEWSVDPFSGELRDGLVWGRGAVDMKDMDAMIIAAVRQIVREGLRPRRDLVVAMFSDEENGGTFGARWMVENHPELFAGATEAISEVGGYSADVRGQRVYLVQTAEKGGVGITLRATGTAGHGSQINRDNPVTKLARAVARIGNHEWPQRPPLATLELLRGVADLTGIPFAEENYPVLLDELGSVRKFVGATFVNTSNPTQLMAGYKQNVIPGTAEAVIDCRTLPGQADELVATLRELCGDDAEVVVRLNRDALEAPMEGRLWDTMVDSLLAEEPTAKVLPYTLSGGTDNKSLALLGIEGYGFAPLRLTNDLDFPAMFHGVDERVPASAIEFGTKVLGRFLLEA
ncbi:M20/M25/M40 family metallo-hydrolase [Brevibacterium samyangense]|uniref:M20/M25/M40 family metallo-hydrolase n=1 Tax=Brevibacterium samyangense TaxID=366888 RepID=A0ABN2TMH1_9MICO